MSDHGIYSTLTVALVTTFWVGALAGLIGALRGRRPGLRLDAPVLSGFGIRIAAAAGVSLTGLASTVRGGDELVFKAQAKHLVGATLTSSEFGTVTAYAPVDSYRAFTHDLHVGVVAAQMKILGADVPDLALRVTQIGIAVAGLVLIAAAVYDLAGQRAAVLVAWLLVLEPTSIFFSGVIHKESLILLAEGLVAFGGTQMWQRPRLSAVPILTAGCMIALTTRPYVGWFLIAASAIVTLQASLRGSRQSGLQSAALVGMVLIGVAAAAPTVLNATSNSQLKSRLQTTQDANTGDDSNLKLERVDYSTRSAVVVNLPRRIRDVLVRPYPWQVSNTSQQIGVLGTLAALATLLLLASAVAKSGRAAISRAGPLIYTAAFMTVAYALSAGNAGTAFRYRTHVLAMAIGIVVVLRASRTAGRVPSVRRRRYGEAHSYSHRPRLAFDGGDKATSATPST